MLAATADRKPKAAPSTPPRKALPVRQIVSRPLQPPARPAARPAAATPVGRPAGPPSSPAPPPVRAPAATTSSDGRLGPAGAWGIALIFAGALGIVLDLTVPWFNEENADGDKVGWDDINDTFALISSYYESLVMWPLWGFGAAALVGVALVAADLVPLEARQRDVARFALLLAAGTAGYVVALTGFRLLGLYLADAMSDGETEHLHAAPYVNLGLGLIIAIGSIVMAVTTGRRLLASRPPGPPASGALKAPAYTALIVALGFLALPLVPYGSLEGPNAGTNLASGSSTGDDQTKYLGEGDLLAIVFIAFFFGDESLREPGNDLGFVHAALWIILVVSLLSTLAAVLASATASRGWGFVNLAHLATALPIVLGLVFGVMLYVDIPAMKAGDGQFGSTSNLEAKLGFNYFPLVVLVATAGLYIWYLVSAPAAFARGARPPAAPRVGAPAASGPGRI